MHGDATSSASAKAVLEACVARHRRIDLVVRNLERSDPSQPAEVSEGYGMRRRTLTIESVDVFCHLVLPLMGKQKMGRGVVNNSPVVGLKYTQAAHSASKAAVSGLRRRCGDVCHKCAEAEYASAGAGSHAAGEGDCGKVRG